MENYHHPEDIDLQKYWLILKRHRFPAIMVWCVTVLIATVAAFSVEKTYEAYGKLRFSKENTTSSLVTEAGEKVGKLDSLSLLNTPVDTEAEVIRSAPIVTQVIESLNLRYDSGEKLTYDDFITNLKIKGIPGTDILRISYSSRDSQEAQLVVDKLMEIYLEYNVTANRTQASAARQFIAQQLPATEAALKNTETALRDYQQANQIVDLEEEGEVLVEQIGELNQQIEQIKGNQRKITAQIAELEQKLGISSQEALVLEKLNDSEPVQQAFTRLKQVEDELATQKSRFRDQSPVIIRLEEEKAARENLLQQRIRDTLGAGEAIPPQIFRNSELETNLIQDLVNYEVERQGLATEIASLQSSQLSYQQRASALPQLQKNQRDLERQLAVHQTAYESLLNNLQQTQIVENQNVGNAQIISPAIVSPYPVSTSKKLVMAAGVVAGSLLYVVTAFLLELRQPSLQTLKEIRYLFDYTLLGMIPNSRKKRVLPRVTGEKRLLNAQVVDTPNASVAQAYNSLQANLKFISPDHQLQTIVVGSSVSQEGRSTVAAKLSVAMASLGSRVLLVDGDLHHPQQHHIWGLINQVGLSQVIMEQILWYQAVASVLPNLDVLPSGLIPPNSLALLDSQRMESLVAEWRNEYDFIIFDTPPLLLLADALTLSKFSDGILLVVRPGIINSASATAAQELVDQSAQNVLGLVVNGVEDEAGNYYQSAENYFQARADVELVQAGIQEGTNIADNHIHAHELLDFFSQLAKNSQGIKPKPIKPRLND